MHHHTLYLITIWKDPKCVDEWLKPADLTVAEIRAEEPQNIPVPVLVPAPDRRQYYAQER